MATDEVKQYYDTIAKDYDSSRFDNTYGKFIAKQERKFLNKHLNRNGRVLNLGCGTGRFMEYCTDGADFSPEMLKVAKQNHPHHHYETCDATDTPYEDNSFDAIICFHLIMHLTKEKASEVLLEAERILKPGGQLIFDYPSKRRRNMTKYKAENWHGANDYTKSEIANALNGDWEKAKWKGVLFFPIHRFPSWMRKVVYGLDSLMTASPFKNYSSYLILSLRKK